MSVEIKKFIDYFPGLKNNCLTKGENQENQLPLIQGIASSLDSQSIQDVVDSFTNEIKKITEQFTNNSDLKTLIQAVEMKLSLLDTDLWKVFSFICEQSIIQNISAELAAALDDLSNHSKVEMLYFLAAWMHINRDEIDLCIETCLKLSTNYSPVLGLLGQCYIEKGKYKEAVTALEDATEIGPYDAVNWYLLSRAYLKNEQYQEAWDSCQKCLELQPKAPDIPIQMALIANSVKPENRSWKQIALLANQKSTETNTDSSEALIVSLHFSIDLDKRDVTLDLIKKMNFQILMRDQFFKKEMGSVMKRLNEKCWPEASIMFISKIEEFLKQKISVG